MARISGKAFTAALKQAAPAVEAAYVASLQGSWQRALEKAGATAATQFAVTAAADWQPPAEGAALTVAQINTIAAALRSDLEPVWLRAVLASVNPALGLVEISWDVKHPVPRRLVEQAGQRAGARLGDAAQFILRDTLAEAYDQGLDVRETSARIQAQLREAAPWQAGMLARSDLNSLANGASKAAAKEVGMGYKTWLSAFLPTTRETHAQADGQTVPIDATFLVGGEEADYPGDPNLSDAESCNCVCTLAYGETLSESEGLLADAGGIMMRGMATKAQRTRRYERRAAHGKGKGIVLAGANGDLTVVTANESNEAVNPVRDALAAAETLPAGVKACSMGGTPGYSGGGLCHMHDGTPAGKATAVRKAQADARKKNAQALVASPQPRAFSGIAAIEGQIADDNSLAPRVLLPDSISWPEMPLSFMAQTVTAEGHDGAAVAGRVDEFARKRGVGMRRTISMAGEFTTPFGIDEIAPMVHDETMRYVSVDLGATEWSIVTRNDLKPVDEADLSLDALQSGEYALGLTSGKMKAVTLVPTQAIEGAMIALTASADEHGVAIAQIDETDEDTYRVVAPITEFSLIEADALVASGEQWAPPREWFDMPELPGKMPLTVTKDGRVYGHLATWDSCHASFLPSCIPPPRSPSNYAYFHVAELDTEEGDTVTVGKLMFSPTDGGHANRGLSASKASQYYDRTGMAAAFGRVSDGAHGIWFAGAINPRLSPEQRKEMRQELRLHPPSGDWRPINGQYELICALAVAVPGFPTPRTEATIVASGDKIELLDAIIASSGVFEPDPQALFVAARMGIADEDVMAERTMRALAARADGMDALAALAE